MRAWRVAKERRSTDLSGEGAAIAGGRWNDEDVPAVYMGLSPAICCLEAYVHASGKPKVDLKLTCFELPDEASLFWAPEVRELPDGWQSLPADRPSMNFGTKWLRSQRHLGLIVPSAVLPLERNLVVNPGHPAISQIRILAIYDFEYDARMLERL